MGMFTGNKDWYAEGDVSKRRNYGTVGIPAKRERDERKIGSFKWNFNRGPTGAYSPNAALSSWMERTRNKKYHSPYLGMARKLKSAGGMLLTQAGGPKKSKSSRDTMQESYSTIETRIGKPVTSDPSSGFEAFGAPGSGRAANVAQMYKEKRDRGAARRVGRGIL
jgi:hypothetical protein